MKNSNYTLKFPRNMQEAFGPYASDGFIEKERRLTPIHMFMAIVAVLLMIGLTRCA